MNIKEIQVADILTKSKLPDADYVINPYIGCSNQCRYCYAEFMKRFANIEDEWGEFIIVKNWEKRIPVEKLNNKTLLISSVTDPYNTYEAKYRKTEKILQEIKDINSRIEILTKSSLLLRDVNLLKGFKNLRIGISLGILDESKRKIFEPGASPISERLKMIETLIQNDIKVYIFQSPYFPGISDFHDVTRLFGHQVESYAFENLNLRGGYKHRILQLIKDLFPNLYGLYDKIYNKKDPSYWQNLEKDIIDYMHKEQYAYRIYFYHEKIRKN